MEELRNRFVMEKNDQEAAKFMENVIYHAYDRWTTNIYDEI